MEWREVNSTGRSEKAFVSGASQLKVEGETDRLIAAPGLVRRDFRLYENRLQGFCTRSSLRHGLVSSLTGRVQCREGFKFKSHFAVDTVLFFSLVLALSPPYNKKILCVEFLDLRARKEISCSRNFTLADRSEAAR